MTGEEIHVIWRLRVKLDLYPGEDFNAHAAIVVTAPGVRGEVCMSEDGKYLSWSRDYGAQVASATPEPGRAAGGTGLGELAGAIVASVIQAMTVALPGAVGDRWPRRGGPVVCPVPPPSSPVLAPSHRPPSWAGTLPDRR
jgi:hypothetical protein